MKEGRLKEAMFYKRTQGDEIICNLCYHRCRIKESKRGICCVRENRKGILYSLVYGRLISRAVDPIEKKPLFHFLPKSSSFSVATVGCNFSCRNCQNADIAQMPQDLKRIDGEEVTPNEIVRKAKERGCESISYTYTEPTIFFEYAFETAMLAQEQRLRNVFVSNGYMTDEAVKLIAPYLDAINIDLKGSESFYRHVCGARMQPVVDNIKLMKELGIWVEVTTLVIPTLNDSEDDIRKIAEIIAGIDSSIPWHISAFHPAYKLLDKPATPAETILRARDIGIESGLRYVYVGNLPDAKGENTHCYECGQLLIERIGYVITQNLVSDGKCPYCSTQMDGVWSA